MGVVQHSIWIDAAPSHVSDVYTNLDRIPQWQTGNPRVLEVSGGGLEIAPPIRCAAAQAPREIARAFVVSEDMLAKRIARAKRKIVRSNVPYRIPSPDELGARLNEVLTVIYLVFNEGYLTTAGSQPIRRDP